MKPTPDKLLTELHSTGRGITPEERQQHPFLHYCCEWDYLPIDPFSPEFESCLCFPERERKVINEVVRLREALEFYRDGDGKTTWIGSVSVDGGRTARAVLEDE